MKQILIILISCVLLSSSLVAQTFDNKSISQLTALKKKAVSKQDYQLAAKYKRAIELKKQLSVAVKAEDYQKAADLKKELQNLNGNAPLTNSNNSNVSTNSTKSASSVGYKDMFSNTVYLHNNKTGENTKLELQTAKFAIETYNAYWVAGSSSFWTVKGYHSTVQVSNKDDFTFVIKMGAGVDPGSIVSLVKLDLIGKKSLERKQLDSKTTAAAYSGAQTENGLSKVLPISFKRIGDDLYEIVVNQMILPGEYAFKFGVKWYLFGAENRVSNNPDYPVTPSTYSLNDFYNLPADAPNVSWLGIDCSILQIRCDYNVGKDEQIKRILLDGINFSRDKYLNHGKIEGWLRKKHRIDYQVAFGYDWTLNNLSKSWIIPRTKDPNSITENEISKHIKEYKINNSGIGMVLIPVLADIVTHKYHAYMVVFDFDTRKTLEVQEVVTKMITGKNPRDVYFAKEFLILTKIYVSKYYGRK